MRLLRNSKKLWSLPVIVSPLLLLSFIHITPYFQSYHPEMDSVEFQIGSNVPYEDQIPRSIRAQACCTLQALELT